MTGPSMPEGIPPHAPPALTAIPRLIQARTQEVTVIGDVILDRWWRGSAGRISREAPVPVVDVKEYVNCPGGAANTAANLAALGGRVRLITLIGDDAAGHQILELLTKAGVDTTLSIISPKVTTATKTRVIGSDQVIVRIDHTGDIPYPQEAVREFEQAVLTATAQAADMPDAEIICDYDIGLFTPHSRRVLSERVARAGLSVVDAHHLALWAPFKADVITPNAQEACLLVGEPLPDGNRRADYIAVNAPAILAASGASAAAVTLDRDGTMLIEPEGPTYRTFAHPVPEQQASGAGDTFVAALTLARVCGASLRTSTQFAQAAADIVVQRFGTSVCTSAEIERSLAETSTPVLSLDELAIQLESERNRGRRVVFTNGCFDILHRGHTSYLWQAKKLGDILVVALNDDDSVRRLKGADRPVNTASDRAAVLAAFGWVDYITIFATDTPIHILETLKPDIYAKGGDYTPEMLEETPIVHSYGGEVCILDYVPANSTTDIVQKIRTSPIP